MRTLPWIVLLIGCASQPAPKEPTQPPLREAEEEQGTVVAEETATPEDYQAINDEMQRKMDLLHQCYEKEQEERMDRSFTGTLTISIVIGMNGEVSSVQILEDNLDTPRMNKCLIDNIKAFTFPKPSGDVRLDLPINFAPRY